MIWNATPSTCAGGEIVWIVKHPRGSSWEHTVFETEAEAESFAEQMNAAEAAEAEVDPIEEAKRLILNEAVPLRSEEPAIEPCDV